MIECAFCIKEFEPNRANNIYCSRKFHYIKKIKFNKNGKVDRNHLINKFK